MRNFYTQRQARQFNEDPEIQALLAEIHATPVGFAILWVTTVGKAIRSKLCRWIGRAQRSVYRRAIGSLTVDILFASAEFGVRRQSVATTALWLQRWSTYRLLPKRVGATVCLRTPKCAASERDCVPEFIVRKMAVGLLLGCVRPTIYALGQAAMSSSRRHQVRTIVGEGTADFNLIDPGIFPACCALSRLAGDIERVTKIRPLDHRSIPGAAQT